MTDDREILEFVGGPYDGLLRLAPEHYTTWWMRPGFNFLYVPGIIIGYCWGRDGRWHWFNEPTPELPHHSPE